MVFGAEDGTQTRDPQLGRLMLYRLSYFRRKWARMDSNHRRRKPADLQSAPFGHSGTCPFKIRAEDGTQTRDPQLGRLMLYRLSYFRRKWAKMDSNHRRRKPADLQSAPFGHSGICPFAFEIHCYCKCFSQLRCKGTTIFLICKQNQSFLSQ